MRQGFSLVELVLVLLIAGFVLALSLPRFGGTLDHIAADAAARDADGELNRWFRRLPSGSLTLDVAAANVDQLQGLGVPRQHIFHVGLCTKTHDRWFDSYRSAGPHAGRMAGLIRVRP